MSKAGFQKPVPVGSTPTADETKEIEKWETADFKAQTQIELNLSDSQMIHIAGATTAAEMWDQLKTVKESTGQLGIMSYQRSLYRCIADESTGAFCP